MEEKVAKTKTIYQYAVKVIQGEIKDGGRTTPIGPGIYFTSVNVHNPWRKDVKYAVKLAISGPNGKSSTITNFQCNKLGPDATTEYDHLGFQTLLGGALPSFLESYFVIESEEQLDVVGVYSGAAVQDMHLGAMHMERVPARAIPLCKNLNMVISTGIADWQIIKVPTGSILVPGKAPIVNSSYNSWALPTGQAHWVGTTQSTEKGVYIYELRFCLCWTFQNAKIIFDLWADNEAEMSLNNIATSPAQTPLNYAFKQANVTHIVIPSTSFRIGENILQVKVKNNGSASGMLLQGTLTAIAADCFS